jgi:hypothetical protein
MRGDPVVKEVRSLLDRLVASEGLPGSRRESVADDVAAKARKLPRPAIVGIVDRAVGGSKARRRQAVYVLSEVADTPEVAARIGEWLADPDREWRSWLIQTVEQLGLRQYGVQLERIIRSDPEDVCRDFAIHAAGTLRAPECLNTLLEMAESQPHTHAVAWALKDYATDACRPHLRRYFEATNDTSLRVVAAWGLAKLKEQDALQYLVAMLDDPDDRGPQHFTPGQSIRAAQAVSDLFGWPFQWNRAYVAKTKDRLARKHGAAEQGDEADQA